MHQDTVEDLVVRFGGPVAHGLLDSHCQLFRSPRVDGVIGYRDSWGCAVALGDPVCRASDVTQLTGEFRDFCLERGRDTVFAAASEAFAAAEREQGAAAVEFGKMLIYDPRVDPQAGGDGRELRKKVLRARREAVVVREYQPVRDGPELALERALAEVARGWLRARRGLQIYVSEIELFERHVVGRRWFYACVGDRIVGVLVILRMQARSGYLLQHLLAAPSAPVGVAELLVADCLALLGSEGCRFATFGPAPADHLGADDHLGSASVWIAHLCYATACRMFHMDRRTHFQRKFRAADVEPTYIVFDPPRVRLRDLFGMARVFHVSLR